MELQDAIINIVRYCALVAAIAFTIQGIILPILMMIQNFFTGDRTTTMFYFKPIMWAAMCYIVFHFLGQV